MAGRTRGNPKDPERARRKILEAALQQFGRTGYRGTRTSDIAKAAGYSEATIFHHFGTKANLFREVVSGIDADTSWFTPDADSDTFVVQMYRGELAYHRDARWRQLDRVWAEALAGERDLLNLMQPQLRGTIDSLSGLLARFDTIGHPQRTLLAKLLMAVSYGARVLRRYDPETLTEEEAASLLALATQVVVGELGGSADDLARAMARVAAEDREAEAEQPPPLAVAAR
jgi:AcrR family transcriptional regulator